MYASIFTSNIIEAVELPKDLLYVGIVIRQIEILQSNIQYNEASNLKRLKLFKSVLIAIPSTALIISVFLLLAANY